MTSTPCHSLRHLRHKTNHSQFMAKMSSEKKKKELTNRVNYKQQKTIFKTTAMRLRFSDRMSTLIQSYSSPNSRNGEIKKPNTKIKRPRAVISVLFLNSFSGSSVTLGGSPITLGGSSITLDGSSVTYGFRQLRTVIRRLRTGIRQLRWVAHQSSSMTRQSHSGVRQLRTAFRQLRTAIRQLHTGTRQLRCEARHLTLGHCYFRDFLEFSVTVIWCLEECMVTRD